MSREALQERLRRPPAASGGLPPRYAARIALILALAAAALPARAEAPLPDPTRPPRAHESALERQAVVERQTFQVTAIKISGDMRSALVNDRLVGVGDRVGDGRIVEILPGEVVIEYLSERNRVALLPATVRRPAAGR